MNKKFNIKNDEITIGQYLMQIRESLGFSREKIAEQLCLKTSIILDIEENTNKNNIDLAFLRGYIRAYAKLMNIPDKEIIFLLDKNMPIKSLFFNSTKSCFFKKLRKKTEYYFFNFSCFIIIISIFMILILWWQEHKALKNEINNMAKTDKVTT